MVHHTHAAKLFLTMALLLGIFFLPLGRAAWQKPIQPSLSGGVLTCLAIHPLDPAKFLLASGHDIFESERGNAWRPLWSQTDANAPFKRLFSFLHLPDFVFALSSDTVFMGDLKNRSWRVVYHDVSRVPISFAVHALDPDRWFVGTERGLLETEDGGKTWSPSPLFRESGPVPLVFFDEARLFLATENALYISAADSLARQVFTLPGTENESAEAAGGDRDKDASSYLFKIHDLIATRNGSSKLFLATRNGVFQSMDHGYRWEPLPQSGLQSTSVLQLASSAEGDRLYAATPRGIYAYNPRARRWTGLFEGLARDGAQSIAVLNDEKLLAITEEGFVQYPLAPFSPETGPDLTIYQPAEETLTLFKELLSMEPTAREVHKHVIQYADVSNGKIKRWQTGSRLAALLPNLSFSKSFSRSASIDIDRGGTNDPDRYIIGPADSSKSGYRTLSWDFGDMIYSSDQTSIDSREKLMVELRHDLLSEATRIYYERRRLQIDLLFTPPASEQEHLEDLLRMDELTTLLDGMTDGFFSKRLERIYEEKPELNGLWTFTPGNAEGGTTFNAQRSTNNVTNP